MVREVIDQHGRLDILVNTAGITIDRTVAKMTDVDWLRVIPVSLSGALFVAQAALDHMIERGTGRIISVSSVIGETGQANYAASMWGLSGLTKSLANEAFAAQALAVARALGLPPDRTNPNGSGVSLGHPIGATGAILAVKALHELRRTGGRSALTTMRIGGGQRIAAIFERG